MAAFLLLAATMAFCPACRTENRGKPDDGTGQNPVPDPGTGPGEPGSAADPRVEPELVVNEALTWLKSFGMGWNLGNHFDSHDNGKAVDNDPSVDPEWWDGNATPSRELYANLYRKGFRSVRIPVTWMAHSDGAPDYAIEESFLSLVEQNVAWARDAGLKVILNIHHDGADSKYWLDVKGAASNPARKAEADARLVALWTQIAGRFRDEGDYLMFEAFNEVHDGGWGWSSGKYEVPSAQSSVLNAWLQIFVDAVRATGGNNGKRWLGCPGYCASPELTMDYMELPDDPAGKLAVSVHMYEPSDFTLSSGAGEKMQWGHTAAGSWKASSGELEFVTTLKALYDKYLVNDIPVYIGEVGCKNKNGEVAVKFKKYYIEYTWRAFTAYGMPAFIWDNGSRSTEGDNHAYINHNDGTYLGTGKEYTDLMYKAVYSPKSDTYSLGTIYDSAP